MLSIVAPAPPKSFYLTNIRESYRSHNLVLWCSKMRYKVTGFTAHWFVKNRRARHQREQTWYNCADFSISITGQLGKVGFCVVFPQDITGIHYR